MMQTIKSHIQEAIFNLSPVDFKAEQEKEKEFTVNIEDIIALIQKDFPETDSENIKAKILIGLCKKMIRSDLLAEEIQTKWPEELTGKLLTKNRETRNFVKEKLKQIIGTTKLSPDMADFADNIRDILITDGLSETN